MKSRIIVLICAAAVMAACGGNSQSSSSCPHHNHEGHNHGDGKACTETNAADLKKVIRAQAFIKPDKVDAFLAVANAVVEKSRAEAGNISYSLYQDPQDKTRFLFFEEWKNQAAVDTHFAAEHFQQLGEALNDCSSAPAVITIYDTTAEKVL
ncbi:MAG: antibiotic biosynthesis monooxygenase [Tannerella sp.]|jgi:quinol monooxygenase YgiN|nr:antibiotic biosynthesis monooxygenase [Tannerella sp.]